MKDFFKSKLNVAMFVLQCVALFLLCLCNIHIIFLILAFMCEGSFFIILGASCFVANKKMNKDVEIRNMLPLSDEEKNIMAEQQKKRAKGNKLKGILYVIFGVILIFLFIFQ